MPYRIITTNLNHHQTFFSMVEFNPDGSIKMPSHMAKRKEDNKDKLLRQRCLKIRREIVNFDSPKKCVLHIILSERITDNRFIQNLYDYFKDTSSVPAKITKISEKEFDVEIGTDFRRCTDCNDLINRYREFMDGNIIEEKGSCTFEGRIKNFAYEDYFE